MVRAAADPDGVLLEGAKSRGRLTRVAQATIATRQYGNDRSSHTRHAAQVRDEIESDSLGAQDRRQGAIERRDPVPGRNAVAIRLLASPPELRVDLKKRCLSEREAGENAFGLRGDYRPTSLVTRRESARSNVVCHAIFA